MNPKRRRYTWVSLDMNTRNQIDCILIGRRFRNGIKSSKSYPGADCGSDHILVVAKLRIKLRKLQTPKQVVKYQLDKLRKDNNIRKEFYIDVSNRYKALEDQNISDLHEDWNTFERIINEAAEKTIPKSQKKKKQKWMSDKILDMMEERRQAKAKDPIKYKELDKIIRQIIKQKKNGGINNVTKLKIS